MKLVFVGAGGFRTPGVCEGLYASPLVFDEIVLYDPDATRLRRIESVVDGLALERGRTLPLLWTTNRAEALAGADFVLCAIRPGGLAARVLDEQVPLEHGVIGQETTGAGGILFALRTLPALLDLAAEVAERAPQAWFLNFTNPAGLTTEALQGLLGPRVVGICDAPPTMYAGVAAALQVPEEELQFGYFGLNHLAWLGSVRHGERELLPQLLDDDERLARTEEGRLFGGEWLRLLGLLPNEYLVYYYRSREVLDALREGGYGRGAYLLDQQREFYSAEQRDPSEALALWRATRDERNRTYMAETGAGDRDRGVDGDGEAESGYAGVALQVVQALHENVRRVITLNTRNRGSISFLDDDAVVEVPCVVDAAGVTPLAVGDVPLHCRGLVESVKAVERLTIAAVRERSPARAVQAMALHPLVRSLATARAIVETHEARRSDRAASLVEAGNARQVDTSTL